MKCGTGLVSRCMKHSILRTKKTSIIVKECVLYVVHDYGFCGFPSRIAYRKWWRTGIDGSQDRFCK
jgi:hypothetical protein